MRTSAFRKPGNRVCVVKMIFGFRLKPMGVGLRPGSWLMLIWITGHAADDDALAGKLDAFRVGEATL